jgi:hypothetical protein
LLKAPNSTTVEAGATGDFIAARAVLASDEDREGLTGRDGDGCGDGATVRARTPTVEARSALRARGLNRDRRHAGRDDEILLGAGQVERLRGGVRGWGRDCQQQ